MIGNRGVLCPSIADTPSKIAVETQSQNTFTVPASWRLGNQFLQKQSINQQRTVGYAFPKKSLLER